MKELEDYTEQELIQSIEAELAKSMNELRCAQGDLSKSNGRLRFALAALYAIKNNKDKKE